MIISVMKSQLWLSLSRWKRRWGGGLVCILEGGGGVGRRRSETWILGFLGRRGKDSGGTVDVRGDFEVGGYRGGFWDSKGRLRG